MKILIVDDDASWLADVKSFLELFGKYRIFTAIDGASASRLLSKNQDTELVITSLNISPINGLEILLELRMFDGRFKPKKWLMTGKIQPEIQRAAMELGVSVVVEKQSLKQTLFQEIIGSIPE